MLLALLLASFLQVSALNLRERATTIPVKTAGATYTYGPASDAGPPTVTTVAGLISPGSPDLNYNAAAAVAKVEHVLILSYDGFHQSDLETYVTTYPQSTLQRLLSHAVEYTNGRTSIPSDSFPGSQAYMTGASSRTHGVYYDVSYDRSLYPPGSGCVGPRGTVVAYDETIDANSSDVSGGGRIDPNNLPLEKTAWGGCAPVYPNNFVRVNNIFEIARFQGMKTCYSDKHPAYVIAKGPSGLGLSEDYFPEVNAFSDLSGLEYSSILSAGLVYLTVDSRSYDDLHWSALQNWTLGLHYDGSIWVNDSGAPSIYGADFQSISFAEKGAGYVDGNPSSNLEQSLRDMDTKLGELVATMESAGMYDKTLIMLSAKHGQSPIDRSELKWVDPDSLINATAVDVAGSALDDAGLLWLANSSDTALAVKNLQALKSELHILDIWSGASAIANGFGDASRDSRAPDIVIKTEPGVIFTRGSAQKTAEHGGFNHDDVAVALFASHPMIKGCKDNTAVSTRSIAPTALKALGLDPLYLEGVRAEATPLLPGLPF